VDRTRVYASPDVVPAGWEPDRPADIEGRQPTGERLGWQGPDQGYVLTLASRIRPQVRVQGGESVDDALRGCAAIALRRASMFGRAPVMADLRIALTIWGFLDAAAPADLVSARRVLFEGLRHGAHHYAECRSLVDMVPEATLRMNPEQAVAAMPGAWRTLTGV
jgi:hypothetical protein